MAAMENWFWRSRVEVCTGALRFSKLLNSLGHLPVHQNRATRTRACHCRFSPWFFARCGTGLLPGQGATCPGASGLKPGQAVPFAQPLKERSMGTSHEVHDTSLQGGLTLVPSRHPAALQNHALGSTPKLSPEVVRRLTSQADALAIEFPELKRRILAMKVGRLLTSLLSPRRKSRGRPRSAAIDSACELLSKGLPWRQILWKVMPRFGEMSAAEQVFHRQRMQRAVYMRRRRSRATNMK